MSAVERAVLGCILIDDALLEGARAQELRSEHFGDPRHKTIYAAMCRLKDLGQSIDLVTLQAKFSGEESMDDVGGIAYLASLDVDLPDIGHFESYVLAVRRDAVRRLIGHTALEFKALARSDASLDELVGEVEHSSLKISQSALEGIESSIHVGDAVESFVKVVDGDTSDVIETGYNDIDDKVLMSNGDLIIIAGRPGMGKTSLALNICTRIAGVDLKHVGFFSLEMSARELGGKILADLTKIPWMKMRQNMLSDEEREQLHAMAEKIRGIPLHIDDTGRVASLDGLMARAKGLKMRGKLDLLCIDYLQLVRAGNKDLRQDVTEVTRSLKLLSRDLRIPTIAVSQLSRAPEHRRGKRPELSDLRESGSIEQDANAVMFVFREGYYKEMRGEIDDTNGKTEILIRKNRSGPTGTVILKWHEDITSFEDQSFGAGKGAV